MGVQLALIAKAFIRNRQLRTIPVNQAGAGVEEFLGLGVVVKQKYVDELIEIAVEKAKQAIQ